MQFSDRVHWSSILSTSKSNKNKTRFLSDKKTLCPSPGSQIVFLKYYFSKESELLEKNGDSKFKVVCLKHFFPKNKEAIRDYCNYNKKLRNELRWTLTGQLLKLIKCVELMDLGRD